MRCLPGLIRQPCSKRARLGVLEGEPNLTVPYASPVEHAANYRTRSRFRLTNKCVLRIARTLATESVSQLHANLKTVRDEQCVRVVCLANAGQWQRPSLRLRPLELAVSIRKVHKYRQTVTFYF